MKYKYKYIHMKQVGKQNLLSCESHKIVFVRCISCSNLKFKISCQCPANHFENMHQGCSCETCFEWKSHRFGTLTRGNGTFQQILTIWFCYIISQIRHPWTQCAPPGLMSWGFQNWEGTSDLTQIVVLQKYFQFWDV